MNLDVDLAGNLVSEDANQRWSSENEDMGSWMDSYKEALLDKNPDLEPDLVVARQFFLNGTTPKEAAEKTEFTSRLTSDEFRTGDFK